MTITTPKQPATPSPPAVQAAIVRDVADPEQRGRVRVELTAPPDASGGTFAAWARLLVPLAGAGRGTWLVPEVGDEVLVGFEHGDLRRPVVLGGVWNGVDGPPAPADAANDAKIIRTRSGLEVRFDDAPGAARLVLETPGGRRVILRDDDQSIRLEDGHGTAFELSAAGATVTSPGKVTVHAGTVEISAGMVHTNAGMATFSGVVQADTVITNTVVASTYTPGAGNLW